MDYTYIIVDGGYEVYRDGKMIISQTSYPHSVDRLSMDSRTSEQMAKLIIEKLFRRLSPIVTEEEEMELSSVEVSDERIVELVDIWADKVLR